MLQPQFLLTKVLASYLLIATLSISSAGAETVDVKYQGQVSLDTFDCPAIKASSFVNRLCYDAKRSYLVVLLKNTYYQYCAVDAATVSNWRNASSLGKFYNANIKAGNFDCRAHGVPD